MPKIVSIGKGRQELNGIVAEFNETGNSSVLINAIEYALKHSIFESDELYSASLRMQDIPPAANLFEEFSRILPIFSIKYETERPDPIGDRIAESFAQSIEAHKNDPVVVQHGISDEENDKLSKIRERCEEKYAQFRPAWAIVELLEEAYPEELDPGKVIGDYYKLLFPYPIPKEVVELEHVFDYHPQIKLPINSALHRIIKDIGCWIIDTTEGNTEWKDGWHSGLNNLLDPENRISQTNNILFSAVWLSMMSSPDDFFLSWLYGWVIYYNGNYSDISPDLTELELLHILYFCSIGINNAPIIQSLNNSGSVTDPFLAKLCSLNIPNKIISYITFEDILDIANISLSANTNILLECIFMQYSRDRKLYYGGVSIYDDSRAMNIAQHLINKYDNPAIDFTMMFAEAAFFMNCTLFYGWSSDENYKTIVKEANTTQNRYIELYMKSAKEGFHELGNAFLSIYIFARAVHCKGRFGNLNKLIPLIDESIHHPGFQILKHTLKVVVEVINDYFADDPIAQLTGRVFRNYLPAEAKLHLLQPKETRRAAEEINAASDAESFLLSLLGKERWEKLTDESRDYLRSTEILWKQNYMAFGCGRLDWSQLVIGYCKAIEKELLDRLDDFYQSMEFDNYLKSYNRVKPREATAGWVLKELSISDKFPDDLKNKLAMAKITVYEDKNLLRTLITIFAKYRNLAAHKDPLDMIKYTEFKKMYFQDRVIHRFIDTIS